MYSLDRLSSAPRACRWNFTPSPGWSKEEVQILKLCLMSFGIGKWVQILDTGLLPGKMIQQLSGQTQRLLGQQALAGGAMHPSSQMTPAWPLCPILPRVASCTAAFNGLQLDIDRVRADNDARTGVRRKAGLIIHTGGELGHWNGGTIVILCPLH